jgi:hypothetical protein
MLTQFRTDPFSLGHWIDFLELASKASSEWLAEAFL